MNKKLLNSFTEYYCPYKNCKQKLSKIQCNSSFLTKALYCKNCLCVWDEYSAPLLHLDGRSCYIKVDIERLNQLKEHFNEQKTAE
jgi:hypothetical protein